mgnify:CR=1 FL=1
MRKKEFPTKYGVLNLSHIKNPDGSIKTEFDAPDGLTIIK